MTVKSLLRGIALILFKLARTQHLEGRGNLSWFEEEDT